MKDPLRQYIVLWPVLCFLLVQIAFGSPISSRPLHSSPPLDVITSDSVLPDVQVPHRFQARFLRELEQDQFNELYRRKGGGGGGKGHSAPAAPAHHDAAPPAHPAQAAHAAPPAKPSKHETHSNPPPGKGAAPAAPEKPKKPSLGERIKEHFHKLGEKMKAGFQKFKEGAKKFFHKVGEGLKTVGLKIAKFAVKAAAVVHTWTGKVVGLVCKPLGRAIEAGAHAEGALADKLNSMDHHQSAKEQKAWKGLDIAQKPAEYAAKAMEERAKKSGSKAAMGAAKAGGIALKILL